MLNNTKATLFALMISVSFTTANAAHPEHQDSRDKHSITITEPWIRSAPINAPALGLFMDISNNTNQDIKLVSIHVEGYQRVELHRTVDNNGLMKMIKQDFIPIAAQGDVHLKPGSWHAMLIGPDKVPSKGEEVMISLKFNNGSAQSVFALVRKGKMMMKHHSTH